MNYNQQKNKTQVFFEPNLFSSEKKINFDHNISSMLETRSPHYLKILNYIVWVIKKSKYNVSEASYKRIAQDLGICKRTVLRAFKLFRKLGIIKTSRRRFRSPHTKSKWASYTNITCINELLFSAHLILFLSLYLPAIKGIEKTTPSGIYHTSVTSNKVKGVIYNRYINCIRKRAVSCKPFVQNNITSSNVSKSSNEPVKIYRDRSRRSEFTVLGDLLKGALTENGVDNSLKKVSNEDVIRPCISCNKRTNSTIVERCGDCKDYGIF